MPFTFNGCGTRYYGSRDTGTDGSFITTEWITFVYLPLFPLRSVRVLRQGKSKNLVVFHSQSYQAGKVPLSWPQVRNVYFIMAPIAAVILYFSWSDIRAWAVNEWVRAQPLRVQAALPESPLGAADAAAACGSVMKLEEPAFAKFNILDRIRDVVNRSNFTAAELKDISSQKDLEEDAFAAYSGGYLTWSKPIEPTRSNLGTSLIKSVNTGAAKLSSDDAKTFKAYGKKDLQMVMTAFDMGRHDARTSPCSP